jgi:nicotinamide-nucleotide amidase
MVEHADLELSQAAATLGAKLKALGYKLTLAESCTGGMVATAITSIAGSSAWFDRGFVTYSNAAKMEMLDIAESTLNNYGAVSEQTAAEMAIGALKHSAAHISGSITGIAGPDGGSLDKPIGTVCFAWAGHTISLTTETRLFYGNRTAIRQQAAMHMMAGLLLRLNAQA